MDHREDHDERISLAPLDPVEALRALLKVDPDSEPVDTADADPRDRGNQAQTQKRRGGRRFLRSKTKPASA